MRTAEITRKTNETDIFPLTYAYVTDSNGDGVADVDNVVANGAYHECYLRSAPAFPARPDGVIFK